MKKTILTKMVIAFMMFTLTLESKAGFFEGGTYQYLKIIQGGIPTWHGKATTNVAAGGYTVWMQATPGPYSINPFIGFGGNEISDNSTIGSTGTTVEVTHVASGPMTFDCSMFILQGSIPSNLCGQITLRIIVTGSTSGNVIEDETVYLTLLPELNIGSFGGNNLLGCQWNQIRLYETSNDPLWSLSCPPIVEVSVQECTYNATTLDYTMLSGTKVKRYLTSAELLDLSTTGLIINSFTSGSNTISVQPNKYYQVNVVNKVRGDQWIPSYHYFHTKPGMHDYAMRDYDYVSSGGVLDIGEEPSDKWEKRIFKSPDLWNNIPNYGVSNDHQDPDYVTPPFTQGNLMRFNLRNIGCNTAPPENDHELRLFWTRARTDEFWDEHWKFSKLNEVESALNLGTYVPAGSEITIAGATAANPYNANSQPLILKNIPSTGFYLQNANVGVAGTQVEWFPPNPLDFSAPNGSMSNAGNRPVICFLAVINDKANADDPLIWEPTVGSPALPYIPIYPYVKNNNNVVTRNSILIEDDINQLVDRGNDDWDYGWGTVWVNNPQGTPRDVTLCLDWDDVGFPNDFSNYGYIEIGVTEGLWTNWVSSGMDEENLTIISPTLFRLDSTHGCIANVPVLPGSEEQIGVRFVFEGSAALPASVESHDYILSAVYDENYQGSNSIFEVRVPTINPLHAQYKKDPNIKKVAATGSDFVVYPNPAKGIFLMSASLEKESDYTINITDIHGKLISQTNSINTTKYFTHTFDMKGERAGVYYITLQSDDIIHTKKIVLID
jgi:hypothetical protein